MIFFYLLCSLSDLYGHFSIKIHHSGDFNESRTEYIGGKVNFFDMCNQKGMNMVEYDAMLGELGLRVGEYDLWLLLPGTGLPHGLLPIENNDNAAAIGDLVEYSKMQALYTTPKNKDGDLDWLDFSFTQYGEEEKDKRISDMVQEVEFEEKTENVISKKEEAKKKNKRVPPPNPPYRTRKRGRYSMLRVSHIVCFFTFL